MSNTRVVGRMPGHARHCATHEAGGLATRHNHRAINVVWLRRHKHSSANDLIRRASTDANNLPSHKGVMFLRAVVPTTAASV